MVTESVASYRQFSGSLLPEIADRHAWIDEPVTRACEYFHSMPFFGFIRKMESHREFKPIAMELYHYAVAFPKVMGLMLGLVSYSESYMTPIYAEQIYGQRANHRLLFDWMIKTRLVSGAEELNRYIPGVETNACINFAYQLAIEQDRDKWLAAVGFGFERCNRDLFSMVAPKMYELGADHTCFDKYDGVADVKVLDYLNDNLDSRRRKIILSKVLEGITLWAAMLHSWIGIATMPMFDLDGRVIRRASLDCH
ncbi:hypothetical protein [Chitinimonas sp.]|uniref:hypothetical protein n=1 Tax=Chitinimonas sp. TaxID=1934313 RepID=UPI0035AEBD56